MIRRALYILLFVILLLPSATAVWTLQISSMPSTLDTDSRSVLWVKVLNNSIPVNFEDCVLGTTSVKYELGSTIGFLSYIGSGIWITEYTPENLPAELQITAQGDCNGAKVNSTTFNLPENGGLNVDILGFPETAPQGAEKTLIVNVSNSSGIVHGATVQYRIYNLLDPSQALIQGNFSESSGMYNATINLPADIGNYSYEVTATAEFSTAVTGGDGRLFNTIETISGNVTISGTDNKCLYTSLGSLKSCELGSTLNINYTEIVGNPTNISVEVWGNELITKFNLTKSTNTWLGNFIIPESFNLSKITRSPSDTYPKIKINITAINDVVSETQIKYIELYTFQIIAIPSKIYVLGGETIDIGLEVVKPISGEHLGPSDLSEFNISLGYGSLQDLVSGGTLLSVKNYTLQDMTYSNELFHIAHHVPVDTQPGTYFIIFESASDQFNHTYYQPVNFGMFSVVEQVQSGPVIINRSVISNSFEESGTFYEVLNFNNTDSSRVIVRPIILGSISEIVFGNFVLDENDASEDGNYIIEANNSKEFVIGYNITNNLSERYDGTLVIRVFSDLQGNIEKYRTELPLETQLGGQTTNGTLQVNVNKIERNFIDSKAYTQNITVFNKGLQNITVSLDTEGTIKQITSISPTELTIAPGGYDYAIFTQTVGLTDNGIYAGYYVFNTSENKIRIPVNITVDISGIISGKLQVTIENASLGEIIKGEQLNITVEVKNIGESNLSNFTASTLAISNLYSITNSEGIILEPDEIINLEITIHTEKLSEGVDNTRKLIISAEPNAENFTYVSLKVNSNYSSKFESLGESIVTYRNDLAAILNEDLQENKTELESSIKNLEELIKNGVDAWNDNDYNASKVAYNDAEDLSKEIHSKIRSLQNYTPPAPDETPNSSAKAWIFIVIFIILIIVGVVIYLSLVPE